MADCNKEVTFYSPKDQFGGIKPILVCGPQDQDKVPEELREPTDNYQVQINLEPGPIVVVNKMQEVTCAPGMIGAPNASHIIIPQGQFQDLVYFSAVETIKEDVLTYIAKNKLENTISLLVLNDAYSAKELAKLTGMEFTSAQALMQIIRNKQDELNRQALALANSQLDCYYLNDPTRAICPGVITYPIDESDPEVVRKVQEAEANLYQYATIGNAVTEVIIPYGTVKSYISQEAANEIAAQQALSALVCFFGNDPIDVTCVDDDRPNSPYRDGIEKGVDAEGNILHPDPVPTPTDAEWNAWLNEHGFTPDDLSKPIGSAHVKENEFISYVSKEEANKQAKTYAWSLLYCYYINDPVDAECEDPAARANGALHSAPIVLAEPPNKKGQKVHIDAGYFTSIYSIKDATEQAQRLADSLLECCYVNNPVVLECEPYEVKDAYGNVIGILEPSHIEGTWRVEVPEGMFSACGDGGQELVDAQARAYAESLLRCCYCNLPVLPTCVPDWVLKAVTDGIVVEAEDGIEIPDGNATYATGWIELGEGEPDLGEPVANINGFTLWYSDQGLTRAIDNMVYCINNNINTANYWYPDPINFKVTAVAKGNKIILTAQDKGVIGNDITLSLCHSLDYPNPRYKLSGPTLTGGTGIVATKARVAYSSLSSPIYSPMFDAIEYGVEYFDGREPFTIPQSYDYGYDLVSALNRLNEYSEQTGVKIYSTEAQASIESYEQEASDPGRIAVYIEANEKGKQGNMIRVAPLSPVNCYVSADDPTCGSITEDGEVWLYTGGSIDPQGYEFAASDLNNGIRIVSVSDVIVINGVVVEIENENSQTVDEHLIALTDEINSKPDLYKVTAFYEPAADYINFRAVLPGSQFNGMPIQQLYNGQVVNTVYLTGGLGADANRDQYPYCIVEPQSIIIYEPLTIDGIDIYLTEEQKRIVEEAYQEDHNTYYASKFRVDAINNSVLSSKLFARLEEYDPHHKSGFRIVIVGKHYNSTWEMTPSWAWRYQTIQYGRRVELHSEDATGRVVIGNALNNISTNSTHASGWFTFTAPPDGYEDVGLVINEVPIIVKDPSKRTLQGYAEHIMNLSDIIKVTAQVRGDKVYLYAIESGETGNSITLHDYGSIVTPQAGMDSWLELSGPTLSGGSNGTVNETQFPQLAKAYVSLVDANATCWMAKGLLSGLALKYAPWSSPYTRYFKSNNLQELNRLLAETINYGLNYAPYEYQFSHWFRARYFQDSENPCVGPYIEITAKNFAVQATALSMPLIVYTSKLYFDYILRYSIQHNPSLEDLIFQLDGGSDGTKLNKGDIYQLALPLDINTIMNPFTGKKEDTSQWSIDATAGVPADTMCSCEGGEYVESLITPLVPKLNPELEECRYENDLVIAACQSEDPYYGAGVTPTGNPYIFYSKFDFVDEYGNIICLSDLSNPIPNQYIEIPEGTFVLVPSDVPGTKLPDDPDYNADENARLTKAYANELALNMAKSMLYCVFSNPLTHGVCEGTRPTDLCADFWKIGSYAVDPYPGRQLHPISNTDINPIVVPKDTFISTISMQDVYDSVEAFVLPLIYCVYGNKSQTCTCYETGQSGTQLNSASIMENMFIGNDPIALDRQAKDLACSMVVCYDPEEAGGAGGQGPAGPQGPPGPAGPPGGSQPCSGECMGIYS